MEALSTSVIIVSRERPNALARCLLGVFQLKHPNYEVVVVADQTGIDAVSKLPWSDQIKIVEFGKANISKARNAGLEVASGEIVAFIDDDAVPEPSWLMRLTEPFNDPTVSATGGYVRGRNGISFQWRASSVDTAGRKRPLHVPSRNSMVFSPPECQAVKTEGTNCAFRREVLAALGGFDPNYAFYLDETDVNMRLAVSGHCTAIVPLAQVHHGYFASKRRTSTRVPHTLFDIGRSTAIFHRKYADPLDARMAWRAEQIEQRKRLLRLMQIGAIEPPDVLKLLRTLVKGHAEGAKLTLVDLTPIVQSGEPFKRVPQDTFQHRVLSGRIWQRRRLRKEAKKLVLGNVRITLILLSPTTLFHRVRYSNYGYWEQIGGVFGKSSRNQPVFQFYSFKSRVKDEVSRVDLFREL